MTTQSTFSTRPLSISQHGAERFGPCFQELHSPPHQERLQETWPLGQVRAVSGSGILSGPE